MTEPAQGGADEVLPVRCPSCDEETYYLVTLAGEGPQVVDTICPTCGYRAIGPTGALRFVEQTLRDAAASIKLAFQQRDIEATIELKVQLGDAGTVRVRGITGKPGEDADEVALEGLRAPGDDLPFDPPSAEPEEDDEADFWKRGPAAS